jgi:hypothetical protein
MKNTRMLGIVLLVLGIIFFGISYTMANGVGFYFRKLPGASILMVFSGLGFAIFKGGEFSKEEYSNSDRYLDLFWQKAPMLHKIGWIVFAILGFSLSGSIQDYFLN